MTPEAAMTVTDPDGVITGLISQVEPGLDADVVAGVLAAVAPGRNACGAASARALADRPGMLADGRSPAPRVAGSLLIALRRAVQFLFLHAEVMQSQDLKIILL